MLPCVLLPGISRRFQPVPRQHRCHPGTAVRFTHQSVAQPAEVRRSHQSSCTAIGCPPRTPHSRIRPRFPDTQRSFYTHPGTAVRFTHQSVAQPAEVRRSHPVRLPVTISPHSAQLGAPMLPGYPTIILSRLPGINSVHIPEARCYLVSYCPESAAVSAGSTAAPLPSRHGSAVHASIRCTAGGSPPQSLRFTHQSVAQPAEVRRSHPARLSVALPALRTAGRTHAARTPDDHSVPAYLFLYNSSCSGGLQGYNATGCL